MRKLYVTLAVVIFTVEFSGKAIGQSVDSYDPIRFGVPETIGGYPVLAVLTEDNFLCMRPGQKRLVLQSPQLTIDNALFDSPKELIEQELQELKLTQWRWEIVGPGVTREQLVSQLNESYRLLKEHGCTSPRLSKASSSTGVCSSLDGSERTCTLPRPGYEVIQNHDVKKERYKSNNGQSVYLVAPVIGSNQDACRREIDLPLYGPVPPYINCYSAFLNNGITDGGYFLQVGLMFVGTLAGGKGYVVWVGTQTGPSEKPSANIFSAIPYIPGHVYYTTIAFSPPDHPNAIWWTCAADNADSATYTCQPHPKAKGKHLIYQLNTSVFAENFNKKRDWYKPYLGIWGFSSPWRAYGAKTYINGIGYPWSSEEPFTQHSCNPGDWPLEKAISGSLKDEGAALFEISGLPTYCDPGGWEIAR